jgi:carboxyl-terminal processing protease
MIQPFFSRMLLLVLSGILVLPVFARQTPEEAVRPGTEAATNETKKAAWTPIRPGKYDATVAWYVARMLEDYHYSKHTLDREWSSKFLDRYLETLDPQHLHFLQSDLAQFEPYRSELGDLTINQRRASDLSPAFEIFNRFMERLQQRVAYADELLKTEKFSFDTDEHVTLIRKDLPYPKDLAEAKQLWRDRLRSEFLQEKLNKIEARKRPDPRRAASKNKPQTKSDEEEIVSTLEHTYHLHLKNFTDWNNEDVLQAYLAALTHIYDPHSDYMGPDHLEQFAISMNLKLSGIGAQLASRDGYCTIDKLLDGYPAAKSKKIREKDRIVAVAQGDKKPVDVVDMNLNKVVHLIRGPKGTEVRLTIVPDGAPLSETTVVSLLREDIKLEDQAAKAKILDVPNPAGGNLRLGVIDLKSFYAPFEFSGKPTEMAHSKEGGTDMFSGGKSTTEDVERLLKKLKAEGVQGVVLDLRYNGGGSLEEAVKLTGLFIEQGPVVQVRDWQERIEKEEDKDSSVAYDGPLIVLTSRFSASASEIVAGALQDYGRAIVVGDASTHGKGTVQSVHYLSQIMQVSPTNDLGALKLTIKKFYRASGASTQLRGVTPDIVLPSIWNESKEIGESSLDNPLAWDTVPKADYKPVNMVADFLPILRKESEQRVKGDKDYDYVREDIELYKKQQADRTISLNEKDRLKERDEIDARQKARDKERKARPEPKEKVYEITLRQASKPGLPPPVQKTNTFASARTNLQGTGSVQISNSAAIESAAALDADPDEDKAPPIDVALNETEHILVDYLNVLRKQVAVH